MIFGAGRDPEGQVESETGRLEAFSDGVLAVIITIMALELKAPVGDRFSDLGARLPALLFYILSFTFIGIYWNNHHHLLRAARRVTAAVMWANLHLLFWLSLIPVLTEWVGENHEKTAPARRQPTLSSQPAMLRASVGIGSEPWSSTAPWNAGRENAGPRRLRASSLIRRISSLPVR